jgi:hypothetical protein
MDRDTFDKKRATFRKSLETSKALAAVLAMVAVTHFAQHGDTSYIADFYGDLSTAGKNYVRRASFLKWLVKYAPVKMEEKKFVKDQELAAKMDWDNANGEAKAALLKAAGEVAFYDFDPEAEIVNFSASDVRERVLKLVKTLENANKSKPVDEQATNAVAKLKELATALPKAA